MLVALLLLAYLHQAKCEWIEISQQHYLKPARTTRVYPQISVIKEVERTTKTNTVYANDSLPNPNWNIGAVYKVPGSDVKRLLGSDTVRSEAINFEEDKSQMNVRKIFVGPTKSTSEISKRPTEEKKRYTGHVYYNKDNVKRITFTSTEESLKPLEVLNLSDIDYDEVFPTIEVNDESFSVEQFKHTKHLTAVIPTEEEAEHRVDNLPKSEQNHRTNYDMKLFTTESPSESEDIKVIKQILVTELPNVSSAKNNTSKSSKKEVNGNSDSKTVRYSKSDDINKVVKLTEKPFNSTKSEQIKQVAPKHRKKNSPTSQSNTERTQEVQNYKKLTQMISAEKLPLEKTRLENNVLRTDEIPKVSKIRNPDEVMLEEILHESDESFEDNNHKTPNIGNVKKVFNKSTIAKTDPNTSKQESKNRRTSSRPVKLQKQSTSVKHVATAESNDSTQEASNDQKNTIYRSANAVTTSSTLELPTVTTPKFQTNTENDELETVELNSPTPLPQETFLKPPDSNKHSEDTQEKLNFFVLTSTSNHEKNRSKVKPSLSEYTDSAKVELTTKASSVEQIKRKPGEKIKTEQFDSKTHPAVDKSNHEDKTTAEETLANDTTADTLGTLVKVLKLVSETISRNSRKTLKGKMRYLEELRDTIMASIEQSLEAAFPDDSAPRRTRSARTHARGHVEFPSSESALMTISFLTFAVFLIKLVLQVIQAYKYKSMMPAVVATVGRALFKTDPGDTK